MTNFSVSNSDGKNMDKFLLQDIFQNYCPCPCNYYTFSQILHQWTLFYLADPL